MNPTPLLRSWLATLIYISLHTSLLDYLINQLFTKFNRQYSEVSNSCTFTHYNETALLDLLLSFHLSVTFPIIIPLMWHSFHCLSFSLHRLQEKYLNNRCHVQGLIINKIIGAFGCNSEWLDSCGGTGDASAGTWCCMASHMDVCISVYIALADCFNLS